MKTLKDYILEGQNFLVKRKLKNRQQEYKYYPTTKDELKDIIIDLLKQGETDLNCIDVSNITDMKYLFYYVDKIVEVMDIDVSDWDVSNVQDMSYMFKWCNRFNSDLSNWNVSKVQYMNNMFDNCEKFNSDLSKWNIESQCKISWMFYGCTTLKKNNKIPKWYSN